MLSRTLSDSSGLIRTRVGGAIDGQAPASLDRSHAIAVIDPTDGTELGPLANAPHRARVLGFNDIAKADGADLLTGGGAPSGFGDGYFVQPTAVLTTNNRSRINQEELFGPFATIQIFDSIGEAISIANDTSFGLVAYVWSEDVREFSNAVEISARARFG